MNGKRRVLLNGGERVGESTTCSYEFKNEAICVRKYLNLEITHNIYEGDHDDIDVEFELPNGEYDYFKIITTYLGFGKINIAIEYFHPQTKRLSTSEQVILLE